MKEFFKGWRRKAGIVTLVMACVFTAGWVRSHSVGETLSFPSSRGRTNCLMSVDCSILWMTVQPGFGIAQHVLNWEQHEFIPHSGFYHAFAAEDVIWNWRLIGFGVGEVPAGVGTHGRKYVFWLIPYWSITIPLALISFWLLLSKPSKSTQKKITELIPDESK